MTRGLSSSAPDRGDRWVVAQFVLMALAVAAAWLPPGWGAATLVLRALSVVVGLLGALLVAWAVRSLGDSLTPFPRPRHDARLVERGPYAYVRHPIYAGGLLFFIGLALATSPPVLAPVAALAVLWRAKAALEDAHLARQFDAYADYRERVRGSFMPRAG